MIISFNKAEKYIKAEEYIIEEKAMTQAESHPTLAPLCWIMNSNLSIANEGKSVILRELDEKRMERAQIEHEHQHGLFGRIICFYTGFHIASIASIALGSLYFYIFHK